MLQNMNDNSCCNRYYSFSSKQLELNFNVLNNLLWSALTVAVAIKFYCLVGAVAVAVKYSWIQSTVGL